VYHISLGRNDASAGDAADELFFVLPFRLGAIE
jgi:hypothetical protein